MVPWPLGDDTLVCLLPISYVRGVIPESREETYESIPWDALVTDDARRRRRWLYLLAAVLVVGSLSAAIVRSLPTGGQSESVAGPAGMASSIPTAVTTIPVPDTTGALVEADLRQLDSAGQRAGAIGAWFVSDYFTADGSELTRVSLESLLPPHVELPPHDATVRSFVESVFPLTVEEAGNGLFRVVLIVRSLAAANGEDYHRQPARAVDVVVSPESVTVLDLPRPVPLPASGIIESPVLEAGDAPPPVMAAAIEQAALWGSPKPEPLSVGTTDGRWRVVLLVEDDAGMTWPVAGWFDPSGESVDLLG